MGGQIIQLLLGVEYSILAYRTHQGVLIWQMDLPHCLSMSPGVAEIIHHNRTVTEDGN